jgi:hypothetical protein
MAVGRSALLWIVIGLGGLFAIAIDETLELKRRVSTSWRRRKTQVKHDLRSR